jgi:hypothetical protein
VDPEDSAWVDMGIHESHEKGCFGVSNNTITRHDASYTTNARFVAFLGTFARPVQQIWLSGNDIQDPTTWDDPPLCTIKRFHWELLQQYDCTEKPPPPSAGGGTADNAGAHPQPPAGSQDNINGKLLMMIILLSYRNSTAFIWHSSGGRCPPRRPPALKTSRTSSPSKSVIPTQRSVTEQLTKHWATFEVLHQRYAGTRFEEQGQLHLPLAETQDHAPGLHPARGDEQPRRGGRQRQVSELFWKTLSWIGVIRPNSSNDAFDPALWETFVSTTLGL